MYNISEHLSEEVSIVGFNPKKQASQWYYSQVFQQEAIPHRSSPPQEKLPSLLRAARSLENGMSLQWQSREKVFLGQAKLLAGYEDDFEFRDTVLRYYPTYQSLTDRELRGYFTWRTKLRHGDVEKTSLSFVFLHIYELLNQIGVADPMDGYRQLVRLQEVYGPLDGSILPYLQRWIFDYVIYYDLDPALLADFPQVRFHESVRVLETIRQQPVSAIIRAVKTLSPKWLERSKFYGAYPADCDRVIAGVLKQVWEHCDSRCKKSFVQQYFGLLKEYPVRLFDTAVFCDPLKRRDGTYAVDDQCIYRCQKGLWTATRRSCPIGPNSKLNDLVKTIDARMRAAYCYGNPIKEVLDTKWICKIIDSQIQDLLDQKAADEAKKVTIDYTQLSHIRRDAAITQEKLTVEEEEEDLLLPEAPVSTSVTGPAVDSPLPAAEYRLLQCLLYGRHIDWVRAEGYILSVLLDSINDKLYAVFLDSVVDDTPAVLEDYTDELRKMIHP